MQKPRHLKTPMQLWVTDNRKRLGLTPHDLAVLTGVTDDTARGWESRGAPSQDAIDALVRRFGVPAPAGSGIVTDPGSAELLAALTRYADLVDRLVRQNAALMADRGIILRDGSVPAEDLAEIEAAEQAGIGSTSPRRTPARERGAERRSAVRSAG